MRTISIEGINLIKEFEGKRLKSYQDSVGVWTVGYGHTGPDVDGHTQISEIDADLLLRKDLKHAEKAVVDLVNPKVLPRMTQKQFDVLVSFVYNCGAGAFKASTLLKYVNQNKMLDAANELPKWVNGDNGPIPGLVRRRQKERKLFLDKQ